MSKVTIDEVVLRDLRGYVHTLLDFIDVNDLEDEENVKIVNDGYNEFVEPINKILRSV